MRGHLEKPAATTAARDHARSSKWLLDPIDRMSEVLFGLIMVLTFTGSLSVAQAGRDEVRTMLIGALGCNLAWGIIDAVFYLSGRLAEANAGLRTVHAVRNAAKPEAARRIIAGALPPLVSSLLTKDELESLRQRLQDLPEPPRHVLLRRQDWLAALGVFFLVFLSTLPVVIPFLFMQNALQALRVSNAIALVMLFMAGYRFGRNAGYNPWLMGVSMVILGTLLVALTMALGG